MPDRDRIINGVTAQRGRPERWPDFRFYSLMFYNHGSLSQLLAARKDPLARWALSGGSGKAGTAKRKDIH